MFKKSIKRTSVTGKENSYRQIFKATSIFGGVQVFNILITIVRTKLVAILLGPSGMGIVSLLSSTTSFIGAITNFGLGSSAVKNVSAAYATGDLHKFGIIVAVFRRLVWFTGLLGFIATLVLAPWLSKIAFGNTEYTVAFLAISITLLLSQVSTGQGVILRGTRRVKLMARSSMIGAVMGLVVSIPLYYFFAEDGIVPAIILSSLTALSLTWYFSRQIEIPKVKVGTKTVLTEGKGMIQMGFFISLSGLITMGVSYIFKIFLREQGGLADVGLYNAGFAMVSTYVGMVFTAMSTDYYPRLASVAHDTTKSNQEINQQAEIAILILAPLVMIFLVYIKWVVLLLYSERFTPITTMIHWAMLGIFFKAISWAIGYILLAKGASKIFLWSEILFNCYFLALNLLGYYWLKFTGVGISYFISYLLVLIQVYLVGRYFYNYTFSKELLKVFYFQFMLAMVCFAIVHMIDSYLSYIIGTVIVIVSFGYSWVELNRRLDLVSLVRKVLNK